jgi:hypothetical protein
MNSQEHKKLARNINKQIGLHNRKFVHLCCNNCKRVFAIRTNNPNIYTDKICDNYKCILCKRG